jgi:hypothetical protein
VEGFALAFLVTATIVGFAAITGLAVWLGKVVAPRIGRLADRATEDEEGAE